MAALWMLFMFVVLGFWAAWLNDKEELLHPRSKQRAKVSLFIVIGIGISSAIGFISVQMAYGA